MKLNYKKTIFIGMAFLGISAFWQVYDVIIPLILENTFHLDKTITGVVMSLDNVLALFLLPFFGSFSDRVDTKIGKRTPFILVGTVIAILGIFIIPYANNSKQFILFNVGLAIVLFGTAIYRAPAVALMPDLTPKPLRSKANAIINLMGAVGAVLALISIRLLVPKSDSPDYTALFLSIGAIMLVSFIILKSKINENKLRVYEEKEETKVNVNSEKLPKEVFRSLVLLLASIFFWFAAYNGITTAFSRYALAMWGMSEGDVAMSLMVATVVAILSYIPAGMVASKIGRKKTIIVGILFVTTTYVMGTILKDFTFLIYIAFAIMGIGWAFINVNSFPMVVEMSKSGDIGKYTGTYYTASMAAQILTPILSGFLMDQFGFKILFPYAFVFSILSFITMSMVRHGDSKAELGDKLEVFDVEE
ncbi:MAG: SLC45 family MFS transporter [Tissierellia bacterium]|nr:SLC45 family MFS transporter [Tissierellia bacterium]